MRTVLPRFYVAVLRWEDGWPEEEYDPAFCVRDRTRKNCNGADLMAAAGLGIKLAMATAAHHNRYAP